MNEQLFGLGDVMRETGQSYQVVYKLIHRGRVPSPQKVGRTLVFSKQDVENIKAALGQKGRNEC